MATTDSWFAKILDAVATKYRFSPDDPVAELSEEARQIVLRGNGGERVVVRYQSRSGASHDFTTTFEGVIPNLERRYRDRSEATRLEIERYMTTVLPDLRRDAARPESLAVTVGGRNIIETTRLSVTEALGGIGPCQRG